jgi:prepilin-type N-terminal cleavage/methylation domain-containing protein
MRMLQGQGRFQRGTTLVEVLIALAIMSTVGASLFYALNVGIIGVNSVSEERTAMDIARSQLEYVKTQNHEQVKAIYSGDNDDADGIEEDRIVQHSPDADYDIEVDVVEKDITDPPDGIPDCLLITITVSYSDKSVELSGYKSNW